MRSVATALLPSCTTAAAASPPVPAKALLPRIAVFDFELINTSLESTGSDDERCLEHLDQRLRTRLAAPGRFTVVDIAPVRARIAAGPEIRNCNGCEIDYARVLRADLTMAGTVQKVSKLILNINLYEKNVPSGALKIVASADIRGNTDESWAHGLDWLPRYRVLVP